MGHATVHTTAEDAASPTDPAPAWRDLLALARPRLAFLGLLTVVLSYVIAKPPSVDAAVLWWLVAGSLLALGGASVLNQVIEHEADSRMRRTQERPIPAGRVDPRMAALYGVGLTVLGLAMLWWGVNSLSAACAGIGLLTYIVVYTPMKPHTSLSTVVGAIPGAVPVLMGWAAATGELTTEAWALFGILFLWQLPHFLAIAWMYRTDYGRAGFRMLPVEDPGGASTARQVVLYGVALLPVSLLPSVLALAGPVYFFGALILGLLYLAAGIRMGSQRTGSAARRLLRISVLYLPVLLGLLALDRSIW
jgi:protoheme IX farnesyltransferase